MTDAANGLAVYRPAFASPVQINNVQETSPLLNPATCNRDWVSIKYLLLAVIPLTKTDTLAAPQVEGRKDQHGSAPEWAWPTFPTVGKPCAF